MAETYNCKLLHNQRNVLYRESVGMRFLKNDEVLERER